MTLKVELLLLAQVGFSALMAAYAARIAAQTRMVFAKVQARRTSRKNG